LWVLPHQKTAPLLPLFLKSRVTLLPTPLFMVVNFQLYSAFEKFYYLSLLAISTQTLFSLYFNGVEGVFFLKKVIKAK
jgi:hypothetical protein